MERKIKFRGKELHSGEWVEGTYFYKDDNHNNPFHHGPYKEKHYIMSYYSADWNIGGWSPIAVDPNTVSQFTGMKDKDGNEIYENDILELTIPDGSTRRFVVKFASENRDLWPLEGFDTENRNTICINGWSFVWKDFVLFPSVIDGIPDNERMTIIGNTYDNPELLENE